MSILEFDIKRRSIIGYKLVFAKLRLSSHPSFLNRVQGFGEMTEKQKL